jgi:hypothetical protein
MRTRSPGNFLSRRAQPFQRGQFFGMLAQREVEADTQWEIDRA